MELSLLCGVHIALVIKDNDSKQITTYMSNPKEKLVKVNSSNIPKAEYTNDDVLLD